MLGLLTFSACNKERNIKGNGTIISEERTVTEFDRIEVSGSADVFISNGSDYSVIVETDSNILPLIETEVHGAELEIGIKKNTSIRKTSGIKVYVTTPTLNGVEVSGSGNISSDDSFTSSSFDIDVSGSGDLDFQDIITDYLIVDISGSGDVDVASSENTENHKIDISGSGDVNLLNMPTTHSNIKISGSGSGIVNVSNSLHVKISGSGDIRYAGTPTITTDITGSGDVNPY